MGLSQCRPGRDRSVHPACRVRVCNVKLRPSLMRFYVKQVESAHVNEFGHMSDEELKAFI